MLPDIVQIANDQGLNIKRRSNQSKKEILCKCPFCLADSNKNQFYLSLNPHYQIFKCWYCGESGGVFRFISLLEGIPEEEVTARYRKRKLIHPAQRLSRSQRMLLKEKFGYAKEPNWEQMRQRDRAYYMRTLDSLLEDWNNLLEMERQEAYFLLTVGISAVKYKEYVEMIRAREKEVGASLLKEGLMIYSCAERPAWTERIETFVREGLKK